VTVLAFGSAAQAQFGVPGGIAPYAINSPAAATAGGGGANCYWQPKGHGGGQNECTTPSPTAPVKPPAAGQK
jgi:hypothetical protein